MQNTFDPKGDPIPKEYKRDQQAKPSFRSSGRTHNRHSTQTRVTSSRRPQRNTTDGETDGGLNEDGARKQNHDNRGVSETGDRQQSTQPQGNKRRRSKPRHMLRRHLPRGKDNHQAAKTPEEQERKEGSLTDKTRRQRTRTTRGRAPLATEGRQSRGAPGETYRPTVERRQELSTSRKEKPREHGDRPKGRAERRPEVEKEEGAESSTPKNGPKRRRRERERVVP